MEKRLVSSEFNQLKRFAAFVSEINYFKDNLMDHWKMMENGEERVNKCLDEIMQLFCDLLDTVPPNQVRTLKNMMTDYKVSFVPVSKTETTNVVIEKECAKELVNMAQEQCMFCIKTPEEAESCPIFQLSTCVVPPDRYSSMLCSYSQAEWTN